MIVGISGGHEGIRGFVAAFDARGGKEDWLFDTVPAPNQPGGNTWPANGSYQHGGGAVWMTPAADLTFDLIIFCVANPSPDFNGSPRPGTNLYTNSVVAVHASTGRLAWYFQKIYTWVPHLVTAHRTLIGGQVF